MTRHIPLLLAVVAGAVLAVLTVHFAQSRDVGVTERAQPVSAVVAAPTLPPPQWQSCALAPSAATSIGTGLTVTGTCSGAISEPLICGESSDAFNGSVRLAVDAAQEFFLTVIVPEFTGSGDYGGAMLFAQLVGPAGVLRWTNREIPLTVDDEAVVHVKQVDLEAEPGTSTPGLLRLAGSIRCG